MRTYVVAVAALVVIASSLDVPVGATPIAAPHALDGGALALAQPAQFFHLGKPYCWYQYGWAGPAWYWCGYGTRIGLGWGGVYGWNGWVVPRSYRAARMGPGQRFRHRR
jgi:hypothetical protein